MMKTRSGKSYALNGDFIVLKLKGAKVVKQPSTHRKGVKALGSLPRLVVRAKRRGRSPRKTHKRKAQRSRVSRLCRWARRSLARRFVPSKQRLVPTKVLVAGLGIPTPSGVTLVVEKSSKAKRKSKLDNLVGISNPAAKKRFIRISREILETLGVAVVGRIPLRMLEIIWEHGGEMWLAPHGPRCWCARCRTDGVAHITAMSRLGDALWYYVRQMPVRAILKLIILAPIRTAQFVANKLWRWVNILSDDLPATILDTLVGCKISESEFQTLSDSEIRELVMQRCVADAEARHAPDGWVVRFARHMRSKVLGQASGSSS